MTSDALSNESHSELVASGTMTSDALGNESDTAELEASGTMFSDAFSNESNSELEASGTTTEIDAELVGSGTTTSDLLGSKSNVGSTSTLQTNMQAFDAERRYRRLLAECMYGRGYALSSDG